jgi:hypothetical protein
MAERKRLQRLFAPFLFRFSNLQDLQTAAGIAIQKLHK